jgi:protein O-GlcNAc transferase
MVHAMPQPTIQQAMQAAIEHHRAGRLAEAEKSCQQALAISPNDPNALYLLGVISRQLGRLDVAVELLGRSAAANPQSGWAFYELGCALMDQGKPNEAGAALAQSLRLNPNSPDAHYRLGNLLFSIGRLDQAVSSFRQAVALQPHFAGAYSNLGSAHAAMGDLQQAVAAFRRALAVSPGNPYALCNLGNALSELGQLEESVNCFKQALAARPEFAEAHYNFGVALARQGKFAEAAECFTKAIAIKPDYAEAHADLGNALTQQWKADEAVAECARAIQLRPDFAQAHYFLGNARKAQGRLDEAIAAYRTALALPPQAPQKHSGLLLTLNYQPKSDPASLLKESLDWAARYAEPLKKFSRAHENDRTPDRPLRIGYVSADFRSHVCAFFLWPLLRHHDRTQFRIFCYAQVLSPDSVTQQFKQHADEWRPTVGMTDEEMAAQIRRDGIDVLIDAMGHTNENRLLALARKPAPVQASWLGYVGTTGMSAMDYRLTDSHVDPPGVNEEAFVEKPMRLPDSLWCFDPMMQEPPVNALPALSSGAVTFGSLNYFFKVNETVLTTWARILKAVPRSRLILPAPEGSARQWATEVLSREGIAPDRVEFLGRQVRQDYFLTYNRIDIGLDPFPWNGHTTSLESWWMGVPVVTLIGQTAVGRAGLSYAANLKLPELAARDREEYVQIAAGLAADLPRLAELRNTLRERLRASPLMDGERFARSMESAYRQMWRNWCESGG